MSLNRQEEVGEAIIAAIIHGGLISIAIEDGKEPMLLWSANAAEQLGMCAIRASSAFRAYWGEPEDDPPEITS